MRPLCFLLGFLLDLLVLPLAALMRIVSMLEPRGLNHFLPPRAGVPILLVHGSGSSTFQWLFACKVHLQYHNVHCIQLSDKHSTGLSEHAHHVAEHINRLYTKFNSRVVVIGASMGGVVGAYAAAQNPSKVSRVFTLSSPFGGAAALHYLYGMPGLTARRYLDMHPDSELLQEISDTIDQSGIEMHCFRSYCDFQVLAEDAYPQSAGNVTLYDQVAGHMSLMLSGAVWRVIVDQMGRPLSDELKGVET